MTGWEIDVAAIFNMPKPPVNLRWQRLPDGMMVLTWDSPILTLEGEWEYEAEGE